jgi:hypothetical protein
MRLICAIGTATLLSAGAAAHQDGKGRLTHDIQRLRPSAFRELPTPLARRFEAMGCTIPQVIDSPVGAGSTNVIRGHFAGSKQIDWAVLCSRKGRSTIVVAWGAPTRCPAEIVQVTAADDNNYVQDVGGGPMAFSRALRAVSEQDLRGWSEPPPPGVMEHQGIVDEFVGKAGTVFYCTGIEWKMVASAN